jgi:hypothetical protein
VGGFLVWFNVLRDDSPSPLNHEPNKVPQGAAAVAEAREMIRRRHFAGAVKRLQDARERGEVHPELTQLYREAALLHDLSTQSLEELLGIAQAERAPEQWREKFRESRGKAIVFDDVVDLDPWGHSRLAGYEVRINDERARVHLELKLLRQLSLGSGRRLVFGARLANVAREDGGVWVIRFDPDSGVLLTDEGAAEACGLVPVDDNLRRILAEQAQWARNLP